MTVYNVDVMFEVPQTGLDMLNIARSVESLAETAYDNRVMIDTVIEHSYSYRPDTTFVRLHLPTVKDEPASMYKTIRDSVVDGYDGDIKEGGFVVRDRFKDAD